MRAVHGALVFGKCLAWLGLTFPALAAPDPLFYGLLRHVRMVLRVRVPEHCRASYGLIPSDFVVSSPCVLMFAPFPAAACLRSGSVV